MLRFLQKWLGKWLLLSILWFVLNSIDFVHLQLNDISQVAIIGRVIMAVLDSLVLCWILAISKTRGLKLVMVIFLALFGIKILMTAIEATYLPDMVPGVWVFVLNGLIACLLWSLTAEAMTVGFMQSEPDSIRLARVNWNQKWQQWIVKLIVLALIWMVMFVLGGLVFVSLTEWFDPESLANYVNPGISAWVLTFQGGRAIFWLLLAFPMIKQLSGNRVGLAVMAGCIFAIWMGSNLLLAIDLPSGIRYAHLVELMVENFVFGCLAVLIFTHNPENIPI